MKISLRLLTVFSGAFAALLAPLTQAQSVTLKRTVHYLQTNSGTIAQPARPFLFEVHLRGGSTNMSDWGPAFYRPGAGGVPAIGPSNDTNTLTLNFSDEPNNGNDFMFLHYFPDPVKLQEFYPIAPTDNGQFGIEFLGVDPPTPDAFTAGLRYADATYPMTIPQVVGVDNGATWNNGLVVREVGTTNLQFNMFPEYPSTPNGALVTIGIYDSAGNVVANASRGVIRAPSLSANQPAINNLALNGSWLTPGVSYTLELQYGVLASPAANANLDGVSYVGSAGYYRITKVPITVIGNRAPTATLQLSSERTVGNTISATINIDDPDDNYAYANLLVRTPDGTWRAIRADNSVVTAGGASSANNIATSEGMHTRTFTFQPSYGPGTYLFWLLAVDSRGVRTDAPVRSIEVTNQAPTASLTLSSARRVGETITATLAVDDPDGNLAYANLFVRTPDDTWLAVKADNSVVEAGGASAANNAVTGPGTHQRTFTFSSTYGPGVYLFWLMAADTGGLRTDAPVRSLTIDPAPGGQPPTAQLTLSAQRSVGQTITATIDVDDVNGNYAYANLFVRTPNNTWYAVKADNSIVEAGGASAANTVAAAPGRHNRTFAFTPQHGPGTYLFWLMAADTDGLRTDAPVRSLEVTNAQTGSAPTASFSLSAQRKVGETVTATIDVGDADGNYSFANLFVRTPDDTWYAVRADNSVVLAGGASAANNIAPTVGTHQRSYTFTPTNGPGVYLFWLMAADSNGLRTDAPVRSLTVEP